MALWKESIVRQVKGKEMSTMLNEEQLSRNRYYVQSVMGVIFFLVSNKLSLRGEQEAETLNNLRENLHDSATDDEPCGLFIKLFQYTLLKDDKLRSVYETIPRNAAYTSPSFQNEVIRLLAELKRERTIADLGDKWYTLLCDGLRDATGVENLSTVLRFIDSHNEVCERLLCIGQTTKFDAVSLTDAILHYLQKHNVRLDRML
jgi:Domain of unknown function (DUF4371)